MKKVYRCFSCPRGCIEDAGRNDDPFIKRDLEQERLDRGQCENPKFITMVIP